MVRRFVSCWGHLVERISSTTISQARNRSAGWLACVANTEGQPNTVSIWSQGSDQAIENSLVPG